LVLTGNFKLTETIFAYICLSITGTTASEESTDGVFQIIESASNIAVFITTGTVSATQIYPGSKVTFTPV